MTLVNIEQRVRPDFDVELPTTKADVLIHPKPHRVSPPLVPFPPVPRLGCKDPDLKEEEGERALHHCRFTIYSHCP